LGWAHPKRPYRRLQGFVEEYQPMYDETWAEGVARMRQEMAEHPEWYKTAEERELPDALYYRPAWPEGEVLGFQLYETVSEGTPISLVFATAEELAEWVVAPPEGSNRLGIGGRHLPLTLDEARRFIERGSAVTMMMSNETGLVGGVEWAARHST
jgi:hypothetical protein